MCNANMFPLRLLLSFLFFFHIALSAQLPSYLHHKHGHDSVSDEEALLAFKRSFALDPFHSLRDWTPLHPFCNWTGVACSSRHHRVVSLNLTGMSLLGPISPFIGNLSFLTVLALKNNSFEGPIPYQLGRLFRLRILRLSRNELEGSIPPTLGNCNSLQRLLLSFNHLSGNIPAELGLLSHLEILGLGVNQLRGTIPVELGMLTQLSLLFLDTNNLTGSIPPTLANCRSLQSLVLSYNHLSGNIPAELGFLSHLENLWLGDNQLTGTIPASIGNMSSLTGLELGVNRLHGYIPVGLGMLTQLSVLFLHFNSLTGSIPTSLGNCSQLERLELESNKLSGTVPIEIGKLQHLRAIRLWANHLVRGTKGLFILTALINCSNLEHIDLDFNYFSGILPSSVGQLSHGLLYLSMESNQIEGSIPSEIGNLTNLTLLNLSQNRLNGAIPRKLGQLQNLERLYLDKNNLHGKIPRELSQAKRLGLLSFSYNMFSGQIPRSLGNLPQLRDLYLDHNHLSGKIPSNLGSCQTLELLDLAYNKIIGNIPREVAALQNLQFYFNLSNNLLEGSIPLEIGKMIMVQAIDVSMNQLSNHIPSTFLSCTNLQYLNLSWNAFEGQIPISMDNLKNLQVIDLSHNNLSGTIPMALEDIKMLQHLNLSSNKLTGEVPKGGIFAKLDASALIGNHGLCGTWINLPPCSYSKHKQSSVIKIVMVPVAVGVAILIMCFLFIRFYRKKKRSLPNAFALRFGPPRISYEELVTATQGFNEANLLGTGSFGSVYQGTLSDGTHVAVKILRLQDDDAHQDFHRECNVLKRIRHRNVIRIITSCSNFDINFKALVLPFMSNGSLERWLYPLEGGDCELNLNDRLRIAMEIAQGMAYLHHYSFVQVVHCDLKPSNVLLGDDMTAYIADFGISKLIFGSSMESFTSTNALRGSIGYIAPEYGIGGKVWAMGDVYSFGILLLELLTRKRPTDDMFVEGMNMQKWVDMHLPNRIVEVVDNHLIQDVSASKMPKILACLTHLMQVGLVCTSESPQKRPNMMEIVNRLEIIKNNFFEIQRALELTISISSLLENTKGAANKNLKNHQSWSTSTF